MLDFVAYILTPVAHLAAAQPFQSAQQRLSAWKTRTNFT